jgi:two-component system invasion response regulator UvrY
VLLTPLPQHWARPDSDNVATRVLIVDDQALYRDVARSVVGLVPDWIVAAEADSGERAVALAQPGAFDVVLMDINLPGIDGLSATRRITAAANPPRVVLMSTYQADDLPADASECGAIGYVRKEDLTPRRLLDTVAAASR